MYIIDFDDTLINTNAQKHERLRLLKEVGVSEELFWETYQKARMNEFGQVVYSHRRHAQILKEFGFDEEKIFSLSESITLRSKEFLFTDAVHFLESVKKTGQPMILLSLGDPEAQERRVKKTEIETFFDRIFFVNDTKVHVVKQLLDHHKPEKVWFINDKVKETLDVVASCPQVTAVLRQTPNISVEEYEASGLPYFQTLSEILDYVKQH